MLDPPEWAANCRGSEVEWVVKHPCDDQGPVHPTCEGVYACPVSDWEAAEADCDEGS